MLYIIPQTVSISSQKAMQEIYYKRTLSLKSQACSMYCKHLVLQENEPLQKHSLDISWQLQLSKTLVDEYQWQGHDVEL